MGGVRVDADTQMSKVPGLFAAGECAAGINGANRLGGNSLSDLIVFGKRAGEYAAQYAKKEKRPPLDAGQVDGGGQVGAGPLRPAGRRQRPLPDPVRAAGDRCRTWSASSAARTSWCRRWRGSSSCRRGRPRWAWPATASTTPAGTRRSTCTTCSRCPRRSPGRPSSARRAAGGHFRDDFPSKDDAQAQVQQRGLRRRRDGSMQLRREPLPPMPAHLQADHRGEVEMKATFRIWRGDRQGGDVPGLQHRDQRGHGGARRRPQDPGRERQRPGLPLELQGRQVRLLLGGDQRHAQADVHDPAGRAAARRSRSPSSR